VIRPSETRVKIMAALEMLRNKVDSMPKKKHGNIPLSFMPTLFGRNYGQHDLGILRMNKDVLRMLMLFFTEVLLSLRIRIFVKKQ